MTVPVKYNIYSDSTKSAYFSTKLSISLKNKFGDLMFLFHISLGSEALLHLLSKFNQIL